MEETQDPHADQAVKGHRIAGEVEARGPRGFGLEFNRLEQIPEYAGFLQSAEGKAWLEAQAEASAAANSSGDAGNPPKP